MLIIRTPYRVSFFGGGTDYPAWYREHGGAVLSTTINKYSFLVLRTLPDIFDYKYRIRYYDREEVQEVNQIQVPVIREAIKYMKINTGIDITHHGDLPNRTGIGSSSSFAVSLIHGLSALKHQQKTKRELARLAITLEQEVLGESVGSQDQVAAAFGGFNRIEFGGQSEFMCHPLPLRAEVVKELESWVQIFFTTKLRNSFDITEKKIENILNKTVDLREMQDLTKEAESVLFGVEYNRIHEFASLLNTQWRLKKDIATSITNPEIDDIYRAGINAGAVGGKILGAGGGGFILFLTPPEKQQQVQEALKLKHVPVAFEFLGSQLIYHDYQDQEK
jgi:D-glycero-alpha-D-manno-heptose-7-phosphate kinase